MKSTTTTRRKRMNEAMDRMARMAWAMDRAEEGWAKAKRQLVRHGEWETLCEDRGFTTDHCARDLLAYRSRDDQHWMKQMRPTQKRKTARRRDEAIYAIGRGLVRSGVAPKMLGDDVDMAAEIILESLSDFGLKVTKEPSKRSTTVKPSE